MKLAFTLPGDYSIPGVSGMPSGGIGAVAKLIRQGVTILLVALTVTSLIFLILGGIAWITSSGDKAKIEAARKRLVYSLIGIIIAFLSFMIINIIGQFFGVKLFNITVITI